MTLVQVWGALLIFTLCPLLGALPLIRWLTRALTGKHLAQLGTRNVSVSAAFYHGGRFVGLCAVLSEALKGIAAVGLARHYFPQDPAWCMVALMALIMGRYWASNGAGTTNVVWGYLFFDPIAAFLVFVISGMGFTLLRDRASARTGVLVVFSCITALRYPQQTALIISTLMLAGLLAWIYTKIPDDLDLPPREGQANSRGMFRFFRGDRALRTLDDVLSVDRVGQKAATLSQLKRQGYPVPDGWVFLPGDDPQLFAEVLQPLPQFPLVVRSSAIGEDSELAAAAGLYESILHITEAAALPAAIRRCLASYDRPAAEQYRRDRGLPEQAMAVLMQRQIYGQVSGVAFSRDPIARQGEDVVIEALPGDAAQVVSGQVTPDSYQVAIAADQITPTTNWRLPPEVSLAVQGAGSVPTSVLQQVAWLARQLEVQAHGVPQDIEWTYDGQTLWLLQARPITTLLPIWTRKIAAEVIPGAIRPLTWSVNRPLTCGVWGELFTLVLGHRAAGLDFLQTATLYHSHAYFNASLLGQIFRRMGLPPESLEFLTRGAAFSRPPIATTLRNLPGLARLLGREWRLEANFRQDQRQLFAPAIAEFQHVPAHSLDAAALTQRIQRLLDLLPRATYYSILAPLSAALRQAIAKVPDEAIDQQATPEIAALRSLQAMATQARPLLKPAHLSTEEVFQQLRQSVAGEEILQQFDQFLETYGYLSPVGTDIAVPTWKEDPQPIRDLFVQQCWLASEPGAARSRRSSNVQRRFTLKGQVTEVYSRLLAELRWAFVALEQQWIATGWLAEPGDIFFLELAEIFRWLTSEQNREEGRSPDPIALIQQRRAIWQHDRTQPVPFLTYGEELPMRLTHFGPVQDLIRGIGASPGQTEGRIQVVRDWQEVGALAADTILVVPYTDSGWAPLLAQAKGLIAEVGGKLSHGAIVAREYRIPAVMDVPYATQRFQTGQWVRLDGQTGAIEPLSTPPKP